METIIVLSVSIIITFYYIKTALQCKEELDAWLIPTILMSFIPGFNVILLFTVMLIGIGE